MNNEINTGAGMLRVRVTSGYNTFPLKDAIVTVSSRREDSGGGEGGEGGGGVIYSLRTDESGLTETVTLPAPPRSLSMQPGSTVRPYAIYDVRTALEGYYDVDNAAVQVFDGVTALVRVDMIPESEFTRISPGQISIQQGDTPPGERNL